MFKKRNKLKIDLRVIIRDVQLQKYIESKLIILIIIVKHKLNNYYRKIKCPLHRLRKKIKSSIN